MRERFTARQYRDVLRYYTTIDNSNTKGRAWKVTTLQTVQVALRGSGICLTTKVLLFWLLTLAKVVDICYAVLHIRQLSADETGKLSVSSMAHSNRTTAVWFNTISRQGEQSIDFVEPPIVSPSCDRQGCGVSSFGR